MTTFQSKESRSRSKCEHQLRVRVSDCVEYNVPFHSTHNRKSQTRVFTDNRLYWLPTTKITTVETKYKNNPKTQSLVEKKHN